VTYQRVAVGLAVRPDATTIEADCPRVTACRGVPTATLPSGSVSLREAVPLDDSAAAAAQADVDAHLADTDNPHAVTAAQVGALPITVPWKDAVIALTASDTVLSGEQTVGGAACVAGDHVLLIGQNGLTDAPTTDSENGPWVVQTGAWTRPEDYDSSADLTSGAIYPVREGTFAGCVGTLRTTGTIVVDVTPTLWSYGSAADTRATLDLITTILANIAWGNPAIANGTTPGRLRTTRAIDYRADARFYTLPSTDDLWDLSGEADLAGMYRAYRLLVDAAGVPSFAAGPNAATAQEADETVPDLDGTASAIGTYIAGPVTDFDGAGGLAAQGEIVNGI